LLTALGQIAFVIMADSNATYTNHLRQSQKAHPKRGPAEKCVLVLVFLSREALNKYPHQAETVQSCPIY